MPPDRCGTEREESMMNATGARRPARMLGAALITAAGLALAAPGVAAAAPPPPQPSSTGTVGTTTGLSTFGTGVDARKNDGGTTAKPQSAKELCAGMTGILNSDLQQLAWANKSGDQKTIDFWRDQVADDFSVGVGLGCAWAE
jgi:hypothetical protein